MTTLSWEDIEDRAANFRKTWEKQKGADPAIGLTCTAIKTWRMKDDRTKNFSLSGLERDCIS